MRATPFTYWRRRLTLGAVATAIVLTLVPVLDEPAGADPANPGPCTIEWDGEAGTTAWTDVANWDEDRLPGADDVACVRASVAGNDGVRVGSGDNVVAALASDTWLHVDGGRLQLLGLSQGVGVEVHGGELDVEWSFDVSDATQDGGTIGGAGAFRVTGMFRWEGGAQVGPGWTGAFPTGDGLDGLLLDTAATRTLTGRTVEAAAGMAWTGGGVIELDGDSILHLTAPSGVAGPPARIEGDGVLQVDAQLDVIDGSLDSEAFLLTSSDLFVNVKGSGSTLSLTGGGEHHSAYHVDPGGTLDLRGGTHDFADDSVVTTFSGPDDGAVVVAGDAQVVVAGHLDAARTTVLEGYLALGDEAQAGAVELLGGQLEVDGTVTAASMGQDGGELLGEGTLLVEGDAGWTSGVQSGTGATEIAGRLDVPGAGDRAITDRYVQAHDIALGDGARATLAGDALLDAVGSLTVAAGTAALLGTEGAVTARDTTLGDGATLHVGPGFATAADAGVTVGDDAFLDLMGGGDHEGTFALGTGSQLNLGGETRFHPGSDLVGFGGIGAYETALLTFEGLIEATELNNAGAIDVATGARTTFDAQVVNHGDIRIADGVAVTIGPDGGGGFASMSDTASLKLEGAQASLDVPGGTIDVEDGSIEGTGVLVGDVRNDGAVGSGGDLRGTGLVVDGDYVQTPAGVLVVGVDGAANSVFEVTGSATLAGILAIGVQGAAPTQAFRVLRGATTGEFDSLIGIDGACARIEYDDEGAVLVPQPCVTIGSSTAGEADGTTTFHVGLTDPSADDVTVDYATVDGSATAGTDYEARTGTVTIPAGETDTEITVPLVDDDEEEPEETFTVTASARGGHLVGTTATGTIIDDDREEDDLELPIGAVATDGDFDAASGINATHVVGASGFLQSDETAGWSYGFVSDVFAYLPGMDVAADVNDADHLVGLCATGPCFRADRVNHPVRGGSPNGLNDGDVLVGEMPGATQGTTVAAIWATPDSTPAPLPAVAGDRSTAIDIGDDGTVLGSTTSHDRMTAWVVADGELVEIPRLDDLAIMDPRAVNDLGVAVGIASNLERTVNRAWLWSDATGLVDLGPGAARGINNRDEVVGASLENHGLLWRHASEGTDPIELTDVITDASWRVGRADLINDDGVIVAQATRGGGTELVVLGAAAVDGCDVCIELEPQAARYPNPEAWTATGDEVVEGTPARLHVTIENTDDEVRTATVEVRIDDQLVGEAETVTLQPGEAVEVDRPWDLDGAAWVGDQPAPAQAITATLLDEAGDEDRTLSTEVAVVPRPVVLVHGMNSDAATWAAYQGMLTAAHPGWRAHAIDTMDTKPWTPNTIAENAVLLARYIDDVQVDANAWQVDVVAHSMGGLITRRYIDASMPSPGGRAALAHLVMLGTPNGGSPCADLFTIPMTYELRTDVVARFNERHPDTLGVPASVAVGVHTPFTCDALVTGDDVVPVDSATTGFPDHQLFEIAHTEMTASSVLFRQFVLPRLTGSIEVGAARRAAPSSVAPAAAPAAVPAPAPQLLTRDVLTLGPGQSFRLQQEVPAGLTGFGATAFGTTVQLAIERNDATVALAGADADPFRTVSVPTPATGRHVVVVTNTGGTAVDVPVSTWITGAATRLEATAVQEGPLGAIRITARLAGAPLAATPTGFVAEITGADGQVRSDRMVAGPDGTWSLVVDELRAGGYGVAVRSEDGAFRRSTTTSVDVDLGEDTPGNDAPTAHPVAVAAGRDARTGIRLLGTDPDGDELRFAVVTQPTHGRIGGAPPFVEYVPERGYMGPDAFTFTVGDGQVTSAPATVAIEVGPSPTAITYTRPFPAEGQLGSTVEVGANVLGPLLDGPTGGRMTFTLGDQVVTATTDRGSASASIVLTQPGRQRITISFAGTAEFAPATFSRFFDVQGGTAPVPTVDGHRVVDGVLTAEAGYPVRLIVRGGDAEANELRYEVDFTDDGTYDATVEKATGIPQHQRRVATFDHTYPTAFTGRARVRVTDTAGLVGETTVPVVMAAHRPLGDLRRLVDGAGEAIDGIELSGDGRYVLYQATDDDDALDIPTPLGVLDRTDGTSRVVSVLPDGTVFRFPFGGAMSADGSTVAFTTPAGTDGPPLSSQVYVRLVDEGRTVDASVSPTGAMADGTSHPEGVSADGRYVLFSSRARNLVATPTTGLQLYLRDLVAGTTTLVSVAAGGSPIGTGHDAALSADGRVAVFQQGSAVRVWTAAAGVAERLPVGIGGADPDASGDSAAEYFDLSADGRHVVFGSDGENLSPADGNGAPDVFVHDRITGRTTLVSVTPDGEAGDGLSGFGEIDAAGTRVAFFSGAADLVDGDTNDVADVFVRDLVAGTTRRVSVEDRDGTEADRGSSPDPQLSADGRWVAFDSDATDLVPGDVNGFRDLFALDLGPTGGDPDPEGPTTTTTSTTATTQPTTTSTTATTQPTTTSTTATTQPPTTSTQPPVTTTSTTSTTRPPTTTSTTATTQPPTTTSTTATTQPPATTTSTTVAPTTTSTSEVPATTATTGPADGGSTSTTVLPSTTEQPTPSTTEPPAPGTPPTLPAVVGSGTVAPAAAGGDPATQVGGVALPRTGADSAPLGQVAALLLVGGAALLLLAARGRRQQDR